MVLGDGEAADHLGCGDHPHGRGGTGVGEVAVAVALFEPEEAVGTWEPFVQDSHQGVKHFGADLVVYVLVLLEVHVSGGATGDIRIENAICKYSYLILITDSVPIVNVFALFILVYTFAILSWRLRRFRRCGLIAGRDICHGLSFNHVLNIL